MPIERQDQWLRPYRKILQKNPVHERSVKACMEGQTQSDAQTLYLHAVAPVLVDFVTYVIKSALESGKKRLYFLARDGYQMYLAADMLCKARNLPLDCRYLSVSRYAVRVPEYHLMGSSCLDRICTGGIGVTLEKIMMRAALTKEEACKTAEKLGYGRDYQKILPYPEILKIKEQLKQDEEFLELVFSHSKKAGRTALIYLRQEGLLDGAPFAFVDSGWIGTLQESLGRLLREAGYDGQVEGYYFGLYEIPKGQQALGYHSYFFTPQSGMRRKVYFSNCLFEAIVSAPEGMTLRYGETDGKAAAMTDAGGNPNRQMVEENIRLLVRYVAEYESRKPDVRYLDKRISVCMSGALLKQFMGRPGRIEAKVYGGSLFCDDVLEGSLMPVAMKLTQRELFRLRLIPKALWSAGLLRGPLKESAWLEGSIAISGKNTAIHFWHAAIYKYAVYIRKWIKGKR